MFVRTQRSGAATGAFEMITSTLRRRIDWHELLAAIREFMNHSASDNSHIPDSSSRVFPR